MSGGGGGDACGGATRRRAERSVRVSSLWVGGLTCLVCVLPVTHCFESACHPLFRVFCLSPTVSNGVGNRWEMLLSSPTTSKLDSNF